MDESMVHIRINKYMLDKLERVYTKIPHIYKKNLILFNFMLDAVLCL